MKRKVEVLYITFIDFEGEASTGSAVRPRRMYDAFQELGHNVKLISGKQNDYRARKKAAVTVKEYLKVGHPDICYIEPPSGPFFFRSDRKMIKDVKNEGIPIGLFYRDLYWKFEERMFRNRKLTVSQIIKSYIVRFMQRRDYRLFKRNITRFYLPSESVNRYMNFDNYTVLQPGCVPYNCKSKQSKDIVAIYVGGATTRYGIELLLKTWKNIPDVKLNIVCPKEQWKSWVESNAEYMELQTNIEVHHLSDGPELEELYSRANFALIPIIKTEYNDLAVPIKLYEYVSRNLPVVITNCEEMKLIVEKYNVGIVSCDNVKDFSEAVNKMILTLKDGNKYEENLLVMKEKNMWNVRAKTVIDELLGDKNEKE